MRNVIIIEDEEIVFKALSRTLERNGYNVVGHFSGLREVLDYEDINKVDAAIVDVDLGRKGNEGVEIGEILSKDWGIDVIYATAKDKNDIDTIFPFKYVQKPYMIDDILHNLI